MLDKCICKLSRVFCFLLFHIALNLTLDFFYYLSHSLARSQHQHEASAPLYSRLRINLELEVATDGKM